MIIEVGAGSSTLVRMGAAFALALHITGGIVGMISGTVALISRKGSPLHRRSGNWFFVFMLLMSFIGMVASPFLPQPNWGNFAGGGFTFYMVATAWATVRRKEGTIGRFEIGVALVSSVIAVTVIALAVQALNRSESAQGGTPLPAYLILAVIATLAALGDLRLVQRRGIGGAQRLSRHIWRMCVGLFAAAGSFFLGQQQVFPPSLRGSPLLFLPELAIVGALIFWLIRVRFPNKFNRPAVRVQREA